MSNIKSKLSYGGNQYLFNYNSKKLPKLNTFKNNDVIFRRMMEFLTKKTSNVKRKYLIDICGRSINETDKFISSSPHAILNLRNQINLDEIKYISTIEFDEDYKNKHWVKSILSDCVNMAIMIHPNVFDNDMVSEDDITNMIIPFKNIHFEYHNDFRKKYKTVEEIFYTKIGVKIFSIKLESNKTIKTILKDNKTQFDNLLEAYQFILNDNNDYSNYMFDFISGNFVLKIYYFENITDYHNYVENIINIHLMESQSTHDLNKSIFENYKQALLNYQSKSNYFSKIIKINTLNESNLKLILKNENITCPNPDCFMVEFK